MASKLLRSGHGCPVHVGVDIGAGDVEVDVIYKIGYIAIAIRSLKDRCVTIVSLTQALV